MSADPIEMGAIAAVLLASTDSPVRPQPLTLTAAKAMMGHSEPAAGLVGLLALAAQLTHSAAPGLLHLASLNPYVGSVLNAARGSASMVSMSRQTHGAPVGSRGVAHGGVSSFAFQGTNAHAVLSAAPAEPAGPEETSDKLIHKQRHWVLPSCHCLLTAAHTHGGTVVMQCQLGDARLAFLLDHQVMGRALFPAAGMLEAAAAAARTILSGQSSDALWACTVSDMVITAPIQLTSTHTSQMHTAALLQTSINVATGAAQISSAAMGSAQLVDSASCCIAFAAPAPDTKVTSAVRHKQALLQLLAMLNATQEGEEGTRRRRAGPGAGTGAGASTADRAHLAPADAVGQVIHAQ